MEKVCPVCNELNNIQFVCTKCGSFMENCGIIQDYLDDYSADMEIKDTDNYCIHIFKCNSCGSFERKKIIKVIV